MSGRTSNAMGSIHYKHVYVDVFDIMTYKMWWIFLVCILNNKRKWYSNVPKCTITIVLFIFEKHDLTCYCKICQNTTTFNNEKSVERSGFRNWFCYCYCILSQFVGLFWGMCFLVVECRISLLCYHIEAETKWTPFPRRHFQMHFLEWKCMNFA